MKRAMQAIIDESAANAPAGAHGKHAWFGWIFGPGRTVVLPVYPTGEDKGLVTMEAYFRIAPAIEGGKK